MLKISLSYCLEHRVQLIKFVAVGFTAFGVNFFFFHIFYGSLAWNYKTATTVAYVLSVVCHFLLHRFFTFQAKAQRLKGSIIRYAIMLSCNYLVTLTTMWVVVNIVAISPYFGLVAATAMTTFISFVTMKYFVFKAIA